MKRVLAALDIEVHPSSPDATRVFDMFLQLQADQAKSSSKENIENKNTNSSSSAASSSRIPGANSRNCTAELFVVFSSFHEGMGELK